MPLILQRRSLCSIASKILHCGKLPGLLEFGRLLESVCKENAMTCKKRYDVNAVMVSCKTKGLLQFERTDLMNSYTSMLQVYLQPYFFPIEFTECSDIGVLKL